MTCERKRYWAVGDPAYGSYLSKLPQVAEDCSRWFLARLRAVDAAVQQQDFVCAGRFTAADVAVAYALNVQHQAALDQGVPTTPAPDIRT